jgi:signal transduction histidine kinase
VIVARATTPVPDMERELNFRVAADFDGRSPIALFASNGDRIAGGYVRLPASLPPLDQPVNLTLQSNEGEAPFRVMVHRMPSGELLMAARDMRDINDFHEALLGVLLSDAAVALLLALLGAFLVGSAALGRIDAVTRAIERIVDGDLSQRLPSGGGGDLDRLIHVVNRMLDEIERLMHEVKGVTEDIAHDLRTPLTRLLAGLERVRRRGTSVADYQIAIDDAVAETKDILGTFTALLRIAEVESGARRAGFGTLDLDMVAADVAELYEPVAEAKGIVLSLQTAGEAAIAGDPSLFFEALGNLVDNAIKYSPAGSAVRLRVFAAGDRIGVDVSDTGPGIPEAERGAVLRRYHRVDKCRSTPGSGLGLSLVAAVAKVHNFQLAIEDARPGCRIVLWSDRPALREGASPTPSPSQPV